MKKSLFPVSSKERIDSINNVSVWYSVTNRLYISLEFIAYSCSLYWSVQFGVYSCSCSDVYSQFIWNLKYLTYNSELRENGIYTIISFVFVFVLATTPLLYRQSLPCLVPWQWLQRQGQDRVNLKENQRIIILMFMRSSRLLISTTRAKSSSDPPAGVTTVRRLFPELMLPTSRLISSQVTMTSSWKSKVGFKV